MLLLTVDQTCTGCGVGRYCDRDCQRQEWRIHKLLHQEIEHTRNILTRNEQEEIEREQKEQEDIEEANKLLNRR